MSEVNQSNLIEVEVEEARADVQDPFAVFRRQSVTSEYMPTSYIPIVMRHHFESSQLCHAYSDNHGIYKIKVKDLIVSSVKNWEYNRPPDMVRCPDIAAYMYDSKKPVDTMFYLSYNNKSNSFDVLDGIHRITALKMLFEENSKPLDLLSPGRFGSGGDARWLFEQWVMVNIRFNASKGQLIETFEMLNKSQAVPELYFRDHKKEKRDMIESIANEWCVKFKKHFSSAANPIGGNTNRNKFVDLLDKIYDKHNIDGTNPGKLRELLEAANRKISQNVPAKASVDARVKCMDTGCFLFLHKNDKLEKLI
jgi:hypothetical protein